jgi:hypothetical protein
MLTAAYHYVYIAVASHRLSMVLLQLPLFALLLDIALTQQCLEQCVHCLSKTWLTQSI